MKIRKTDTGKREIPKKSQLGVYSLGILFIKASFTLVAFLITALIVSQGYKIELGDRSMDASIVSETLMYSPALMMTDSVTGKVFVGVVDSNRFDEAQRSATERDLKYYMRMHNDVNYMPMKITLYDKTIGTRVSVYYNKDKYNEFLTYVSGGFDVGKGGYSKYEFNFPVSIGDSRRPGVLHISMVIPNR